MQHLCLRAQLPLAPSYPSRSATIEGFHAEVVKLVDTADLKSAASREVAYGFDSRPRHQRP